MCFEDPENDRKIKLMSLLEGSGGVGKIGQ